MIKHMCTNSAAAASQFSMRQFNATSVNLFFKYLSSKMKFTLITKACVIEFKNITEYSCYEFRNDGC